ncbi:hypothetical protein CW751_08930 [Brumimicrobium salinarum]|uniref:Phosphoribosyl-ATP pyrophosphohydrolase n=1 Tax=Brumimicrobium salinarum TaxID=2058658 RepID=A0A2I0R266_9FLAO|nr:nucleoside triphosphate pyrophosphohydrolase family protein [Brumimicrobium salinarum]PKR80490.1 hypothetical protein CW751_08930 [Brumimicrobium salinarum]
MEKSLSQLIKCVSAFHSCFSIENANAPCANIGNDAIELRYRLMREENEEYLSAAKNDDVTEVADALGDQLYVLLGTILKHGMEDVIVEVFQEIHRANMSKLDLNGKPVYRQDGKVGKGNAYVAPNIQSIIEKYGI